MVAGAKVEGVRSNAVNVPVALVLLLAVSALSVASEDGFEPAASVVPEV